MLATLRNFWARAHGRRAAASYPCLPDSPVYAVGDVHGRADLLAQAFALMDADQPPAAAPAALEIYLGDYIDRGPHSARVLDLLIERAATRQVICLCGNHEAVFLDILNGRGDHDAWAALGGRETLLSYGLSPNDIATMPEPARTAAIQAAVPAAHKDFLAALRFCHCVGGYVFAHAGIRPGVALEAQTPRDLMWIRRTFLDFDGVLPAIVVHGHTPTAEPEFRAYRINIDTGAYMTNRLTCLKIDADGPILLNEPAA